MGDRNWRSLIRLHPRNGHTHSRLRFGENSQNFRCTQWLAILDVELPKELELPNTKGFPSKVCFEICRSHLAVSG